MCSVSDRVRSINVNCCRGGESQQYLPTIDNLKNPPDRHIAGDRTDSQTKETGFLLN
jgi:hypothetical protein